MASDTLSDIFIGKNFLQNFFQGLFGDAQADGGKNCGKDEMPVQQLFKCQLEEPAADGERDEITGLEGGQGRLIFGSVLWDGGVPSACFDRDSHRLAYRCRRDGQC